MIKWIENADLLTCDANYICHQANATSNYAAGLAYYLFKKFPYADIYKNRCKHQVDKPGDIIIKGDGQSQRYIVNMIAQVNPGGPRNCFIQNIINEYPDTFIARLKYFTQCLILLKNNLEFSDNYGIEKITVAFPYKIGSNLAKGNWENYLQILNDFSELDDNIEIQIIKRACDE